jgi:hypothetical protein
MIALLSACASSRQAPTWIIDPPPADSGEHVVGRGAGDSEAKALVSARRRAYARFLERMGVTVEVVDRVVTTETTGSDRQPTLTRESEETVRTRAQGFLKRTEVRRRTVRADDAGRAHAHVLLHVPGAEVERVRQAVKRRQAAQWKPAMRLYRDAVADYRELQQAAAAGKAGRALERAATVLDQVGDAREHETWDAARNRIIDEPDWPYPIEAQKLVQMILGDVTIEGIPSPLKLATKGRSTSIAVEARGNIGAISQLPLALELPSGRRVEATTNRDGRATFTIAAPAHPGQFELTVRARLPGALARRADTKRWPLSVQVTGERRLAAGAFHDVVEVKGVGEARRDNGESRAAAEHRAITAARVDALANASDGAAETATETVVDDRRVAERRLRIERSGRVNGASTVDSSMQWSGDRVTAEVIVQVSAK